MAETAFSRVETQLHDWRDEMVAFQRSITAIPALAPESGGEGEWEKTEHIAGILAEWGFTLAERIDAPDPRAREGVRPNLVYRIDGRDPSRTAWIMAHTDVVPPGDASLWEDDPWTVVEREGRIYGRGVEDNQQGLTSAVFALRAFVELGIAPAVNLGVLLCADEETGSTYGLEYVLANRGDLFGEEDLIIVPDAGHADGSQIEVAEKGALWLKLTVRGRQCHASRPHKGVNAHAAAADLVVRLEGLRETFAQRDELFDPPVSTFEPTRRDANVPNVNTVPGEEIFCMDCRVLPEVPLERVTEEIRLTAAAVARDRGVTIEIEPIKEMHAAPPTPADAPVVEALAEAIRTVHGVEARAEGIGGGTVAACFRRAGIPAAVWATIEETAHQPNESCVIEDMIRDACVFAHVALQT
jgi:succinyl-diaminopimelate desuccinylase